MKKRLTLNTVAEALQAFPPLSQRHALRSGRRSERGGVALAREPCRKLLQFHAAWATHGAMEQLL